MSTSDDTIEQVTASLAGLLRAKNAEGDGLLYHEHREYIKGDERSPLQVVMTQCRVCREVDEVHTVECVVGIAERALRRVQEAAS